MQNTVKCIVSWRSCEIWKVNWLIATFRKIWKLFEHFSLSLSTPFPAPFLHLRLATNLNINVPKNDTCPFLILHVSNFKGIQNLLDHLQLYHSLYRMVTTWMQMIGQYHKLSFLDCVHPLLASDWLGLTA